MPELWLPAEQLAAYFERVRARGRGVVRPKLIVLLDSPAEELLARVHHRGRECERRLTKEQLDRIRQAVREQAGRPELGPVLRRRGRPAGRSRRGPGRCAGDGVTCKIVPLEAD